MNPESDLVLPSLYANHIDGWISTFGKDNVLILDGDNFSKSPWEEMRKAQRFLGLGIEVSRLSYSRNSRNGSVSMLQKLHLTRLNFIISLDSTASVSLTALRTA